VIGEDRAMTNSSWPNGTTRSTNARPSCTLWPRRRIGGCPRCSCAGTAAISAKNSIWHVSFQAGHLFRVFLQGSTWLRRIRDMHSAMPRCCLSWASLRTTFGWESICCSALGSAVLWIRYFLRVERSLRALVALLLRNCLRVLRGVRAGLDPAVCGPDSPRKGGGWHVECVRL